jgi:zinc protease
LQGGDPDRFVNYEKYVEKLTPRDVQQAAKLILAGKNEFIAVQMPEGTAGGAGEEKKKGF